MSEVNFPTNFEELAGAGFFEKDPSTYGALESDDFEERIQALREDICAETDLTKAEEAVAFVFTLLKDFSTLNKEVKNIFVETMIEICSSISEVIESIDSMTTRKCYKKMLFLFLHMCPKAEQAAKDEQISAGSGTGLPKPRGRGSKKAAATTSNCFAWIEWRQPCLVVLEKLMSSKLGSAWPMGIVPENFLSPVWAYCLKLLDERPDGVAGTAHKEIAVRTLCMRVISLTINHFGSAQSSGAFAALSTALLEAVLHSEHMGAIAAEIILQTRQINASASSIIAAELMGDIGHMNMSSLPANSLRDLAAFIESFSKGSPDAFAQAFPTLLPQIDSPAFQIRSALLHACGNIVVHVHAVLAGSNGNPEHDAEEAEGGEGGSSPNREQQDTDDNKPSSLQGRSSASMVRFRDSVLNMLVERVHDSSPYTRAAVLKVWARLLEAGAVPAKRVGCVVDISVDRLFDKNAGVRRNAIALLTHALEQNPFSGSLRAQLFEAQRSAVQQMLTARLTELRKQSEKELAGALRGITAGLRGVDLELSHISEGEGSDHEDAADDGTTKGKRNGGKTGNNPPVNEEEAEDGEEDSADKEMETAMEESAREEFEASPEVAADSIVAESRAKLEFCSAALAMVRVVESALPNVAEMLQSKSSTDVVEALRFFTVAIKFKVNGAASYFKSSFSLVWHQDLSIKNEMLSAFRGVFLMSNYANDVATAAKGDDDEDDEGTPQQQQQFSHTEIARNLIHLVQDCDDAEVASMEKIVGEMFLSQQVDAGVIDAVWNFVRSSTRANGLEGGEGERISSSRGFSELGACIRIIAMVALSDPTQLDATKVALIVRAGFGPVTTASIRSVDGVALQQTPAALRNSDTSAWKSVCQCIQATPVLLKRLMTAASTTTIAAAPATVTGSKGRGHGKSAATTTGAGTVEVPAGTSSAEVLASDLQRALEGASPALVEIILGSHCDDNEASTRAWFGVCEEAMHALFHFHPHPDRVVAAAVRAMYTGLQQPEKAGGTSTGSGGFRLMRLLFVLGQAALCSLVFTEAIATQSKKFAAAVLVCPAKPATAATTAARATKKAGTGAAKTKQAKQRSSKRRESNCSVNSDLTDDDDDADSDEEDVISVEKEIQAGGAEPGPGADAVDAMEEEMGAAAAADADHERMLNYVIEQELVMKNLLSKFLPLISYVAGNTEGKFSRTPLLRATAVLALCRYMSISVSVCESLLPLLFTVLEREMGDPSSTTTTSTTTTSTTTTTPSGTVEQQDTPQQQQIRTTIMIALGDLAFRFPNSVEPWTNRMYSRLNDSSESVRYNTLMVITHLVLNDMIKVKGQVCHVARSLCDPAERIRELAKLFFIKLSERSNNPVYNLLADIISVFSQDHHSQQQQQQHQLSKEAGDGAGDEGDASSSAAADGAEEQQQMVPATLEDSTAGLSLTTEQFQSTMHFLLSFVQKDKQADQLLERLLVRMGLADSARQRRNLAFCISELTVTEKGVRKMVELIKSIKDALYDGVVFDAFKATLARAKKSTARSATADSRSAIEEFDVLLEGIRLQAHGITGSSSASSGAGAGGEATNVGGEEDEDEEVACCEGGEEVESRGRRRGAAKKSAKKGTKSAAASSKSRRSRCHSYSDEEEEEEEDDDVDDNDDEEEEEDDENAPNLNKRSSTKEKKSTSTRKPSSVKPAAGRAGTASHVRSTSSKCRAKETAVAAKGLSSVRVTASSSRSSRRAISVADEEEAEFDY